MRESCRGTMHMRAVQHENCNENFDVGSCCPLEILARIWLKNCYLLSLFIYFFLSSFVLAHSSFRILNRNFETKMMVIMWNTVSFLGFVVLWVILLFPSLVWLITFDHDNTIAFSLYCFLLYSFIIYSY